MATIAEIMSPPHDFETWLDAHRHELVRIARGILRDPDEAEDVVQETILRVLDRSGRGKIDESGPYLARATYWNALAEYWPQFLTSILYAGLATVFCLLLGYPLAYLIAFRAGRWRNLLLILVIAPFFTSFLIRTLAWKKAIRD